MVCIFFGHRDSYGLDDKALQRAVEELIRKGLIKKKCRSSEGFWPSVPPRHLLKKVGEN